MPRFPETLALAEQALRHVLGEQQKLLKRKDVSNLTPILQGLCELALETANVIAAGCNQPDSTATLTSKAGKLEEVIDDLSQDLWTPIQISVQAIYQRIEQSFRPRKDEYGFAGEVRAHYHNLRIRLLEQMLGARMLASSSDLGDECERILQQFLERHLGPMFRTVRGGYICDHQGKRSCQIDVIIVSTDAQIFVPGDSEGGKAHVLVDQVIAVMMITANLTKKKLSDDWVKLQSIPSYADLEKDYPQLAGHPWPFCYIVAAQSDAPEELQKTWKNLCETPAPTIGPQFVITLDSGFLYSGFRRWPAPNYPSNYREPGEVHMESGLFAGLGLAWLITQIQGRSAFIQGQALAPISRRAELFNVAMLKESMPPTWSPRFWTMLRNHKIAGIVEWGGSESWPHNRVELQSLARLRPEAKSRAEVECLHTGVDTSNLKWDEWRKFLRWFRYPICERAGRLLAFDEWIDHRSKSNHRRRVAVFDSVTGEELVGADIDALKNVNDVARIRDQLEARLSADPSRENGQA